MVKETISKTFQIGFEIMLPKSERSHVYAVAFRTLAKYHVFVSGIKIPVEYIALHVCIFLSTFWKLQTLTQHVCMPYYSMTSPSCL